MEFVMFYCRGQLPNEKSEIIARELINYNNKNIIDVVHLRAKLGHIDSKDDIIRV
jgi:hypothetical protein